MSQHKHTAGPWEFRPYTNCSDADEEAGRRLGIFSLGDKGRGGSYVAVIEGDMFDEEEESANARLIAAAPDLLAAIQKAMPVLEEHCAYVFLRSIRQALKNATA